MTTPGIINSLSFDADSKRLAFGFAAANQPRDAYVLDVAENKLEPWTSSEAGPVDVAKFVLPQLKDFPLSIAPTASLARCRYMFTSPRAQVRTLC